MVLCSRLRAMPPTHRLALACLLPQQGSSAAAHLPGACQPELKGTACSQRNGACQNLVPAVWVQLPVQERRGGKHHGQHQHCWLRECWSAFGRRHDSCRNEAGGPGFKLW